ncbi:hypothetical protein [Escherichia phage e4/1c]|uniref:Uncharacterized protein n=1 Tax=Escherichia phage e4/1c TaxID=1495286 RepID=A0A023ZUG3_9CAUD|nr:hypothetical protein e41c_0069 [Escherichia phage e4/1c]AHY83219.1 hypothetical protein [Escherichia phage e4/1c]
MKIYVFTGNLWAANDSEAGDGKRANSYVEQEIMIWIHTYYTGKFNSVMHKRVHDSYESAKAQHEVLGGDIQSYKKA